MTVTLNSIAAQLTTALSKLDALSAKVTTISIKENIIMAAQDEIDQATATIESEVAAEEADIATEATALDVLKAYILAHPDAPSLGALQAAVSKLSAARAGLDSQAAAEVAAEPAPPTPPVV